jgi:hypothetical protein
VSDSGDVGSGGPDGPEQVGSVADEAAKLLSALSGWAKDHGSDLGHGVSDVASSAASAVHNANEHFATGGPDCTYCPICRAVHVVRECSPEVRAHLAVAAASLMQAAAGILATAVPDERRAAAARGDDIEKINLDDDWPDED